jgi:hypothetical protein
MKGYEVAHRGSSAVIPEVSYKDANSEALANIINFLINASPETTPETVENPSPNTQMPGISTFSQSLMVAYFTGTLADDIKADIDLDGLNEAAKKIYSKLMWMASIVGSGQMTLEKAIQILQTSSMSVYVA